MQALQASNWSYATAEGLWRHGRHGNNLSLSRRRVFCAAQEKPQLVITGQSNQQVVHELAVRALASSAQQGQGQRWVVGIGGAPGSDGFHYFRTELDQMPDPEEARARRGAPFTFDAAKFVAVCQQLKNPQADTVLAPSFDHGVGDPNPDAIKILPSHRIVLVEGNYIMLPDEPWSQLRDLLDDRVFVDTDINVCMERVYRRQTGHGNTPDQSKERIRRNDRPNGEQVQTTKAFADVVVVPV